MPKTVNLGFEVPDYSKMDCCKPMMPATSEDKTPTKTAYPCMTIPGNKALARALRVGQKFTAQVTFVVSEVAVHDRKGESDDGPVDRHGGTRVELEAETMTFSDVKVDDAPPEETAQSAIANFFSNKSKKTDE